MRSMKHLREVLEVIIIGQLCGSDMVYQGAKGDPVILTMLCIRGSSYSRFWGTQGGQPHIIIVTCILIMG